MSTVVRGKTDLWTTSPKFAKLLLNPEDGYNLSKDSHKKANFVCPNCGYIIRNKIVRNIFKYRFKCPICSDGYSYPEKFMSVLLNKLNVCFVHDNSLKWSGRYRYDFYIDSMNTIIETHGLQHYNPEYSFHKDNNRDDSQIDKYKKRLALSNGIKHYIEIDCSYSDLEYIKKSILNSELNSLFDLSVIDWNEIQRLSLKSKVIEVCDLYTNGFTTTQIRQKLKLDHSTVTDYLKRGTQIGICNYSFDRRKKVICIETNQIYDSIEDASKSLNIDMHTISDCCHNKPHAITAGGYHWCFLDKYNPDTYILKTRLIDTSIKKVLCVETGKIYNRLSEVKEDCFTPSAVSQVCNGKRNIHKNCHFVFV